MSTISTSRADGQEPAADTRDAAQPELGQDGSRRPSSAAGVLPDVQAWAAHRVTLDATYAAPVNRFAPVRRIRGELRRIAATWGVRGTVLDDLVAVASELIANAICHNQPGVLGVMMRIRQGEDRIRIEVADRGRRLPRPTASFASDQAESGRGLLIVEALSAQWGMRLTPIGKTVWAELELPTPGGQEADEGDSGPGQ
ncbi:ATP-binding protein [Kitasatospora sp. LaBMicrA B282]|uniref:ATP-binding protein n=1 Tax=Kitasatospora sp. LaBMicrA B282 TaxID=3420949 RepID=UPI003D0BBD8C